MFSSTAQPLFGAAGCMSVGSMVTPPAALCAPFVGIGGSFANLCTGAGTNMCPVNASLQHGTRHHAAPTGGEGAENWALVYKNALKKKCGDEPPLHTASGFPWRLP